MTRKLWSSADNVGPGRREGTDGNEGAARRQETTQEDSRLVILICISGVVVCGSVALADTRFAHNDREWWQKINLKHVSTCGSTHLIINSWRAVHSLRTPINLVIRSRRVCVCGRGGVSFIAACRVKRATS